MYFIIQTKQGAYIQSYKHWPEHGYAIEFTGNRSQAKIFNTQNESEAEPIATIKFKLNKLNLGCHVQKFADKNGNIILANEQEL